MKIKEVHVLRIPEDEELVKYIVDFARKNEIRCASVSVIGALKNAVIGYYSPSEKRYIKKSVDGQCEILCGSGNISWKEGIEPFLHLHITLGSEDFTVTGGHLIKGLVFVAEVIIHEYDGRCPRQKVGNLYLWRSDTNPFSP